MKARMLTVAPAAMLATVLFAVAVMLVQASAADAANRYRVEITNLRSGLKADVMWASTQPYQGVFLWPNNTSASQEFDLLDSGDGRTFRIRARHSGLCLMLDFRRQPYTNGSRVIQYRCDSGYRSMYWYRSWVSPQQSCDDDHCTSTGVQYPVLKNAFTSRCLDAANAAGGTPPRQAVLQQWSCIQSSDDWNAGNQLWRFGNEGYL